VSQSREEAVALARDAVAAEWTWDPASMFSSVAEWEEELARVLADLESFSAFSGRLGEGSTLLRGALDERFELGDRADRVAVYAYLGYAVDTTDAEAIARFGRAMSMHAAVTAGLAFVEPELVALGAQTLRSWLEDDPAFELYGHYVDNLLRQQPHVRSREVEEVLGLVGDPFAGAQTTYSALADSDLRFSPAIGADGVERLVSQGTVEALLADPDRELRRSAWESYADGYRSLGNALAGNLQTTVKQDVFEAKVRRHESTLHASLARTNVSVEVFDNTLETYRANLGVWHRYWHVRRRLLGVERLQPYDVWAPLGPPVEVDYEQAVEWICEALEPLGDEYVAAMRRGCLEERWVDVYPTAGKSGGAFSSGVKGTRPFIVMNYDGTTTSLGTLAHELGHSMHSYLAWRAQPPVYADYSLFVAEVASNFHQVLLRSHLLATTSDRALRLGLLDEAFANFHRYLFVMPILACFERGMHKLVERGEGLSAPVLGEMAAELFAEGFGPEVEFERDRVGITWAQFSHLYQTFYVYQYTTGIAGAHALGRAVLDGEDGAVERYLGLLAAGGSRYAIDALREAGVDLSSPEPVESAFATLSALVDELEALA
jgi:oligoendopeptidase F